MGVVLREVTGKLTYYWALCPRCAETPPLLSINWTIFWSMSLVYVMGQRGDTSLLWLHLREDDEVVGSQNTPISMAGDVPMWSTSLQSGGS